MNTIRPLLKRACLLIIALQFCSLARNASSAEILPPAFRPLPLGAHALVGGKVVTKPGEVLEGGTIIIRDGLIKEVGKDIQAPADARVWDMKGLTIYAGFIDPYVPLSTTNAPLTTTESEPITHSTFTAGGVNFYGAPGQKTDRRNAGPGYEIAKITPDYRAVRDYSPAEKTLGPLRELGFTAAVIAPGKGIIRGSSALVALVEENPNEVVIKPDVFQHIGFETHQPNETAYPGSLMGVIASVRQSIFDARHYALDHADYAKDPQTRK